MSQLITASVNHQLDDLLARLCLELAITETQHERAVSAYTTLGEWIGDTTGPLGIFDTRIFAQGSIPLGTSVKPRQSEEFDADLVCVFQKNYSALTPQELYDLVLNRVKEHEIYRGMVEPCDRCVRLNYENQFHLDIVPAVPSPTSNSATRINIPNHTKTAWQHTDPEGFLRWFKSRQVTRRRVLAEKRADVEPMPANGDPEDKTTLQRAVQLLKRRRDVYFDGADSAPKSILLTTLAGHFYGQEEIATDALLNVLDQILTAAANTTEAPIIENPSNSGENLARHWREDHNHYVAFLEYCADLQAGIRRLLAQTDTMKIAQVLQELFDPTDGRMVKKAVASYTEDFQRARESRQIRMTKGGALTTAATSAAARSISIPGNTFFGA